MPLNPENRMKLLELVKAGKSSALSGLAVYQQQEDIPLIKKYLFITLPPYYHSEIDPLHPHSIIPGNHFTAWHLETNSSSCRVVQSRRTSKRRSVVCTVIPGRSYFIEQSCTGVQTVVCSLRDELSVEESMQASFLF